MYINVSFDMCDDWVEIEAEIDAIADELSVERVGSGSDGQTREVEYYTQDDNICDEFVGTVIDELGTIIDIEVV